MRHPLGFPDPNPGRKKEEATSFEFDLDFEFADYEFPKILYKYFRALRFDDTRAWLLAVQGANLNKAKNLIQKGCPHETAFEILF